MAEAKRDENRVTTVIGVSDVDGITPTRVKVNPTTGAMLVEGVGGSGTPGGSDTQVQFNDGGVFGGDSGFTFIKATNALSLLGPLTVTRSNTISDVDIIGADISITSITSGGSTPFDITGIRGIATVQDTSDDIQNIIALSSAVNVINTSGTIEFLSAFSTVSSVDSPVGEIYLLKNQITMESTVSNFYGFHNTAVLTATADIGNFYTLYVPAPNTSPGYVIDYAYGLYIESYTGIGTIESYSLYCAGTVFINVPTLTTIGLTVKGTDGDATNPLVYFTNSDGSSVVSVTDWFDLASGVGLITTFTGGGGLVLGFLTPLLILPTMVADFNSAAMVVYGGFAGDTVTPSGKHGIIFILVGGTVDTSIDSTKAIYSNVSVIDGDVDIAMYGSHNSGTFQGVSGDNSVPDVYGFFNEPFFVGDGVFVATVTNYYGFYQSSLSVNASSVVTNAYGLYIANINAATTLNYAIYTNAGEVRFGDNLTLAATTPTITTDSNKNLNLIPNGTGYTLIGNAGSTSHTFNTNDDFLVSGRLEVDGFAYFDARLLTVQGADVASANNLVLGSDGNTFEITGTTQINLISNINWQNGAVIHLLFTSTPTVKNGQATSTTNITILLSGAADFVASADDVLTLVLSEIGGTQAWREICRSVN